jgi:hypothetical protein
MMPNESEVIKVCQDLLSMQSRSVQEGIEPEMVEARKVALNRIVAYITPPMVVVPKRK